MAIRRATPADVPAIVAMAQQFAAGDEYRDVVTIDPAKTAAFAHGLIGHDDALLAVAERAGAVVGMIAVVIADHPFSVGTVASELAWWMSPGSRGAGVALLRHAEAWAASRGVVAIQMIAPTAKVGAFFEASGYRAIERHYQRRV